MSKQDGGPAFPIVKPIEPCRITIGMTLRDYFAAKAMQGTIAKRGINEESNGQMWDARIFYAMADAMLKAREER